MRAALIVVSLLLVLVVAWFRLRMWRAAPVLASRGEVADVPAYDEGEAYCTDPPPADPVDEHAVQAVAVVDEREQRRHFELWEQQMGADR